MKPATVTYPSINNIKEVSLLRSKRSKFLARLAFIGLLIAATVAFFVQVPTTGASKIPYFDKYVHVGVFFLLSFTLHQAFALSGRVSFLLLGLYGLLIEIGQNYIPGRGSDFYDWLADAAGVIAYFSLVLLFKQRKKNAN
ncbi:MAG: hypothetical protein CMF12_05820 [Idiomarina sp.]|nr:hypothetical protein [Idiomarinaceae bacterium]MBL4741964.1 VanZ family protein [Idiomarina sp.]MBT42023.1 hypothetical protein [Idiomarina sp.]PHQ77416.1 MAG: hypothetical protein COB75_03470 [Idiomarina sp.]